MDFTSPVSVHRHLLYEHNHTQPTRCHHLELHEQWESAKTNLLQSTQLKGLVMCTLFQHPSFA